jgi:predicted N-acyltransferase
MPEDDFTLKLALHNAIAGIPAADWNACAGDDNPFLSHAFLSTLEDSGSACPATGWLPQHVVLENKCGDVVAVVPMYLKSHSYGEYVFDQSWADAIQRIGGAYYPKMQVAIPFSPVPGPRLLCRRDGRVSTLTVGNALIAIGQQFNVSSVHITFCTQQEWVELGNAGWLQRIGMQFHWQNENYTNFDDFLAALSSSRRKVLRRERRDANAAGLAFKILCGDDIKPRHWDAFYRSYQATIDRKWGSAYLTREFFALLSERFGNKIVLIMADHNDEPVAGAFNLIGTDTLFGRNWGCIGDWPFLHFELCYYRAIDFAIEHQLKRVEAGAQGQHKIQRGYLPQLTYSAHWIANQSLSDAVKDFLTREGTTVRADLEALTEFSPFRKKD